VPAGLVHLHSLGVGLPACTSLQVLAVRMPVDLLRPQLGPILEGVLLWAADSKNKFKLKVGEAGVVCGGGGMCAGAVWGPCIAHM
jgi:hypothetical protein